MSITIGFDATGLYANKIPKGAQAAGYTTGSGSVPWSAADWASHPGAVRIDQDVAASDGTADVLDAENGAATFADCPGWAKRALASFSANTRPGQREPAIYCSALNVTNVANALVNGGIKSGVNLWIANWNLTETQAIGDVQSGSGPFPIVAVQYSNGPFFDYDIFSATWLQNVSGNFAQNPVKGLAKVRRGFTSVTLAWDADKNATSYSVMTYWRGNKVSESVVTAPTARTGFLSSHRTYEFHVRAHPGGSMGSDASINVTTR